MQPPPYGASPPEPPSRKDTTDAGTPLRSGLLGVQEEDRGEHRGPDLARVVGVVLDALQERVLARRSTPCLGLYSRCPMFRKGELQ
jgi:hypothetical protein